MLRPRRAGSRQRLYRRQDVEHVLAIKRLLHEEGFTIAGARKALARRKESVVTAPVCESSPPADWRRLQSMIKTELYGLKALLERNDLTPSRGKGK